ncbi:MAG: glycosyltransferase family 4 protein [Pseudonocardia sp.]|nr:glycosyltransferase family 4 protein [Pseudonocardia sp.]
MRIVYLYQYFTTRSMSGGTRAYEQARRLADLGHEVHVVTSDIAAESPSLSWRTTTEDGIRVHWLPAPYSNTMSYRRRIVSFLQFAVAASIKATRLRGDVVFASSTPLTVAIPGMIAARSRRARFVFEVRDLWPEIPIAMGALDNPVAVRLAYGLARAAYRNADSVVALSDGMAEGVARHGYPAERISVVPNAADLDLFPADPDVVRRFRAARPWLQDRPLVVYLGTFGRVNGVGYLVRVAAEMARLDPEVRFLLVGDGVELPEVRRLATELDVLDRTLFITGSVPKADVPAIMGAATVATSVTVPLPALEANSANKFFDALAASRPQAINYGGWQATILRDSGAGIVLDPHDIALAAKDLAAAVRDTAWLTRAGAAARRLAVERFSRDRLFGVLAAAVLGDGGDRPRGRVATARRSRP